MKNGRHISEFYGVCAILAIVGGYFDAYTFIGRGGVFANAQTGNIVLFGISIQQGKFGKSLIYLLPILSFVAGVFIVEEVKHRFEKNPIKHWHQIVLEIEIINIIIVGFIPSGTYNTAANIIVSLTCALQVQGFRRMNGKVYATTMCTGNLRSGTDNLIQYIHSGNKDNLKSCKQYYGIILFFITGAVIGAAATHYLKTTAIFFTLIGLIAALIILKTDDRKTDQT